VEGREGNPPTNAEGASIVVETSRPSSCRPLTAGLLLLQRVSVWMLEKKSLDHLKGGARESVIETLKKEVRFPLSFTWRPQRASASVSFLTLNCPLHLSVLP
jgi:hypothetical protein